MSLVFSVVLKFIILLIVLALIIILIYKFIKALVVDIRENRIKILLIKIATVVIIIFSFNYMVNARNGWNISFEEKQNKKYVLLLSHCKLIISLYWQKGFWLYNVEYKHQID
ncbi:MAG: hypothetical protein ACI8WT_004071 [Clostridium sp.]|jgi:hypothetical protein